MKFTPGERQNFLEQVGQFRRVGERGAIDLQTILGGKRRNGKEGVLKRSRIKQLKLVTKKVKFASKAISDFSWQGGSATTVRKKGQGSPN